MFNCAGKIGNFQTARFGIGRQLLSNAIKDSQSSKTQSPDCKSISCSQTSQEESMGDTKVKHNRLDDAIATNRHADIMSSLKGIESALSKISDSLLRMAVTMEECIKSHEDKVREQHKCRTSKRTFNQALDSSTFIDVFDINVFRNNVSSNSDSDSDECEYLHHYLAHKKSKGMILACEIILVIVHS